VSTAQEGVEEASTAPGEEAEGASTAQVEEESTPQGLARRTIQPRSEPTIMRY